MEKSKPMVYLSLKDYISEHHNNNQRAFARAQSHKTSPQLITDWINKEFIVVNDVLYSPRRKLDRDRK